VPSKNFTYTGIWLLQAHERPLSPAGVARLRIPPLAFPPGLSLQCGWVRRPGDRHGGIALHGTLGSLTRSHNVSLINVLILIGVVLAVFVLLAIFGSTLGKKAGIEARKFVQAIDTNYEEFIEHQIAAMLINNEKVIIDPDSIVSDVLVLIKPSLDGLFDFINKTDLSDVRLNYESKHFSNLVALAELLFEKRHNGKSNPLDPADRLKMDSSVGDAIRADLMKRKMDLGE
jgi:hypothetical protein